ncbi:MAG: sensor histidine kinase [Nocardioides sp.]
MRTPSPPVLDVVLAAGVTAVGLAEIWVPFSSRQAEGSPVASTVVTVLAGLALTQRRSFPLPAALVVLWAWPVAFALAPMYVLFWGQFVPMAIAVFSAARHGRGRVPYLGAAAGAATLLYFDLFVAYLQEPGEIVFHWGVFTVVWSFGYGLRTFEHRARQSTDRAVAAEVAATEQAMAAVVEERTRIARELHDIVAHSVSTMVVQAGAAEQVVEDDPEFARQALATIRSTGASALAEMRRVVVMLRDADDTGALEPQPGLGAIASLLDDARAAGLSARLQVVGTRRDLPAGVDLAAYRIVQEALTNVRRHASASAVEVALTYGEDDLRIEVTDDGVGTAEPAGGHGLVGMRERAALYGGQVEAASRNGTGFMVRAVLPVGVSP